MNNPLDARFLLLLAEVTLKSLVLFGIAFLMARLLRRTAAFARQSVWKATLFSLLLLPILCQIVPAWRVSLPVAPVLAPLPPPAITEMLPPTPSIETTVPIAPAPPPVESVAPVVDPPSPQTVVNSVMSQITLPPLPDPVPSFALPVVLGIYLIGVGFVLLRLIAAFVRLGFLARNSQCCTLLQVQYAAEEAARKLGVSRSVSIRIAAPHSRERIPMTWGWLRPCVLLPAESQNWDSNHLDAVVLHEFAHIARADWLMQQIAVLTCALYWFHPLAWKAARLLKLESERACDETVISAGIAPTDYASVLLATARAHKQRAFSHEGTISMANTTHLAVRIQSLLERHSSPRKPSRHLVFSLGIVSLAGLLALSSLHPADAAEPPAPPPAAPEMLAVSPPDEPAAVAPPAETKSIEPPSHAFKQETDSKAAALMKQVEAKANSIQSLTADVQMNHSFNASPTERGTVRFMKPKLYRLRFQDTEKNFIASNGTAEWAKLSGGVYDLYAYNKGNDTHLPFPLSNFIAHCVDYAPYVGGLGNSKTVYKGQRVERGERFDIIEVRRDKPGKGYIYRLYVGADKIIHRATLISKIGKPSQSDVRLSNIRLNPALSASEFEFTPEEKAHFSEQRKHTGVMPISAPPPAKPSIEFTGKIAWGEAKDGFQTGVRLQSDKAAYTRNDQLPVQYVVRNVGRTPRRIQFVAHASIFLYSMGMKIFNEPGREVEGDLRWRGRDDETPRAKLMRAEITLTPDKIEALPLSIEPAFLNRYGNDEPRTGMYITHWEARIEYRDAEKPDQPRRKMPLPGALSIQIVAASPDPAFIVTTRADRNVTEITIGRTQLDPLVKARADGTPAILYGKEVGGIQMGVTMPRLVSKVKKTGGTPPYSVIAKMSRDRFILPQDQAFRVGVYIRNSTSESITLSMPPDLKTTGINGDLHLKSSSRADGDLHIRGGGYNLPRILATRMTLKPFEERYLYSPELKLDGHDTKPHAFYSDDGFNLILTQSATEEEYGLSFLHRVWLKEAETSVLIQSGVVKLVDFPEPVGTVSAYTARKIQFAKAKTRAQAAHAKLVQTLDECLGKTDDDLVRRLLREGAGIETRSKSGVTVLMFGACTSGDDSLLKVALQTGVEVEARTSGGQTALMTAMSSRRVSRLKTLIDAGANVDAQDEIGRTPLMWACEFKFRAGIELLLAHGANINARNSKGKTALAYAEGHPGLVGLLRQRGLQE